MDVSTVVCVGPSKKTNNKTPTQSVLRLCERILVKTNKKHERGVGESEKVYKICILYAVWMTEKLITTGVSQLNGWDLVKKLNTVCVLYFNCVGESEKLNTQGVSSVVRVGLSEKLNMMGVSKAVGLRP